MAKAITSSSSRRSTRNWPRPRSGAASRSICFPGARHDGVFAIWYGKGPGVDRSGDALKHGNAAGTSRHGGVLLLAGDDHGCKSSTLAHQSEHAFIAASIPVLNPSRVQEILDFGMLRLGDVALFRLLGGAQDDRRDGRELGRDRSRSGTGSDRLPEDFAMPPGGLNIRWPDPPLEQEYRLHNSKLYAALAFARANRLDRMVINRQARASASSPPARPISMCARRWTISASTTPMPPRSGLRLYKIGMTWPLEAEGIRHFAEGLEEILVVEEKRARRREPAQAAALQLARRRAAAGRRQVRRSRRLDPAARRAN